MSNIKQTIERSLHEFEEKYGSFELCEVVNKKDHDRLKSFLLQSQLSLIDAIIEEMPGAMDGKKYEYEGEIFEMAGVKSFNLCRSQILSHLKEVKNELTKV